MNAEENVDKNTKIVETKINNNNLKYNSVGKNEYSIINKWWAQAL